MVNGESQWDEVSGMEARKVRVQKVGMLWGGGGSSQRRGLNQKMKTVWRPKQTWGKEQLFKQRKVKV